MRRAFETYQYLAPAVLTPLAAWLWWRHYDGNAGLAAIALGVPIAHAYLVPAVGTNILHGHAPAPAVHRDRDHAGQLQRHRRR